MLGDGARGLDKCGAVADALEVGQDHAVLRVAAPGLEQGHLVDIGLVAQAHEAREADPLGLAPSRMAVQSAPDCDINAIWPGLGISAANEAFSLVVVSVEFPRQFGPDHAHMVAAHQLEQLALVLFCPPPPISLIQR